VPLNDQAQLRQGDLALNFISKINFVKPQNYVIHATAPAVSCSELLEKKLHSAIFFLLAG
jgi:hypothetical protein